MNTYGRGNPEVERVIAEMNALNAVLHGVREKSAPADMYEAQAMVLAVERQWPTPQTVTDFTIRAAMAKITGSNGPTGEPVPASDPGGWATRSCELVSLAWLAWARNDQHQARSWIAQWDRENDIQEPLQKRGAVQAFAQTFWATAVEALIENCPEDAKRFYNRVYELGSSFGTESHPTVLWTMAASFFIPGG